MRIVTADDSTIMAPQLRSMLQILLKHEVVAHAFNGEEAKALVKEHHPDFVIFDVLMPIKQGDLAAKELIEEGVLKPNQIIMATSQGQEGIIGPLRDLGCGIIIKPYRENQLKAVIERHVHGDAA